MPYQKTLSRIKKRYLIKEPRQKSKTGTLESKQNTLSKKPIKNLKKGALLKNLIKNLKKVP